MKIKWNFGLWVIGGLCMVAICSSGIAEEVTVHVKGGGEFQGRILDSEKPEWIRLELEGGGQMELPRDIVEEIVGGSHQIDSIQLPDSPPVFPTDEPTPEAQEPTVVKPPADVRLMEILPAALPPKPAPAEPVHEIREEEFTLTSKMYNNEEVKVFYSVPVDSGGRPVRSAADIVYYSPFINQGSPLKEDYLRELTTVHGMTVFSMEFKSDLADVETRDRIYYYAESGSYDVVMRAWNRVRSAENLPARNLLVIANSGGSTMAAGLGMHSSNGIDGIALVGGWRYPEGDLKSPPRCVLVTRGDARFSANLEMLAKTHQSGGSMLLAVAPAHAHKIEDFRDVTTPNFHHSAHATAKDILISFLLDVRDARNRGSRGQSGEWPVPHRFHAAEDALEDEEVEVRSLEGLVAEAPGERTKLAWDRNPNRFVRVPFEDEEIPLLVRYPEDAMPKGVVVFGGRRSASAMDIGDALDFLGLCGWIAVGHQPDFPYELEVEEWAAVQEWVAGQPAWDRYPVHWIGWEDAGRDFVVLGASDASSRISSIVALEASLLYPVEGRSPVKVLAEYAPSLGIGGRDEEYFTNEPARSFLAEAGTAGLNVIRMTPSAVGESVPEDFQLLYSAASNLELRHAAHAHREAAGE